MIRDTIIVGLFVLSFAALGTMHVALSLRLMLRAEPWWRGVVALVLPPIGPVYAYREGWRPTAIAWMAIFLVCVFSRLIALV